MAVGQNLEDTLSFEDTLSLANQGIPTAQVSLAFMYENGNGVPQDYAEAMRWYRLAAEQGNAGSQFNLGLMYGTGKGVPRNIVLGYTWLNISAAYGNETAREATIHLEEEEMTLAQIAEAQQLSAEIFERIQQGN